MDDALDLDAVRLLSAWLSARRDLSAHLDLLTAFGPSATEQVQRNFRLVERLEQASEQRWSAYRAHVLSAPQDVRGPER